MSPYGDYGTMPGDHLGLCPCGHRDAMCHRSNAARYCPQSDDSARVRELEKALREAEAENVELRAYRDRMKRGNHGKRGWPDFLERVWSKVDASGPDDCWLWNAYVNPEGYGQMTLRDGNKYYSHRVVYEIGNRQQIPDGLIVRHTCDQPSCHNPAHLIVGTHADNNRDKIERGRHRNRHTGTMRADGRAGR